MSTLRLWLSLAAVLLFAAGVSVGFLLRDLRQPSTTAAAVRSLPASGEVEYRRDAMVGSEVLLEGLELTPTEEAARARVAAEWIERDRRLREQLLESAARARTDLLACLETADRGAVEERLASYADERLIADTGRELRSLSARVTLDGRQEPAVYQILYDALRERGEAWSEFRECYLERKRSSRSDESGAEGPPTAENSAKRGPRSTRERKEDDSERPERSERRGERGKPDSSRFEDMRRRMMEIYTRRDERMQGVLGEEQFADYRGWVEEKRRRREHRGRRGGGRRGARDRGDKRPDGHPEEGRPGRSRDGADTPRAEEDASGSKPTPPVERDSGASEESSKASRPCDKPAAGEPAREVLPTPRAPRRARSRPLIG